eukprot:COSAG05_NODE_5445_length_1172_cov_352.108108_2_plen_30_part_01
MEVAPQYQLKGRGGAKAPTSYVSVGFFLWG